MATIDLFYHVIMSDVDVWVPLERLSLETPFGCHGCHTDQDCLRNRPRPE